MMHCVLESIQSINQSFYLRQLGPRHITHSKNGNKKEHETMTTQTDRRRTVQYDC